MLAVVSFASVARAETAAELEAKGEAFAKDGRYSDAIEAFKAADRIAPRASHVCLIALAYTRRELWPQAEIFLDQCHQRATAADPLPAWVPLADQQLHDRLASANVAAVTIEVAPAVPAMLAVSSFAPDETFAPRTIHLAPGHHVISVEAVGYEPAQQAIDIADRNDRRVVIELHRPGARVVVPPPSVAHAAPSKVPWIVMGAGGAVALAGLATHVFLLQPIRDKLAHAQTTAEYDGYGDSFTARRTATLVLYGAGIATIATGIALRYTVFKHDEVSVALAPTPGGAMLAVGWQR